jgi:hypothetical protein
MKRIAARLTCVFLALVVLAACSGSQDNKANVSPDGVLGFGLSLDKAVYRQGESVVATISVTNLSAEAIWLNSRMILFNPPPAGELDFNITLPSGKEAYPTARISSSPPVDEAYIELAPGEAFDVSYTLTQWYEPLDQPGEYKVTAIYYNKTDPSHAVAWKGEMQSNEVSFTRQP